MQIKPLVKHTFCQSATECQKFFGRPPSQVGTQYILLAREECPGLLYLLLSYRHEFIFIPHVGTLSLYCIFQINIWWVLHAMFLFASVAFPYQYNTLKNSSKMKYIHIGSLVVGLLFPLISVITPMISDAVKRSRASDGEVIVGTLGFTLLSPPSPCVGVDENVIFYSSILPNIIIVEVGVVVLILSIWLINKVYCSVYKYLI